MLDLSLGEVEELRHLLRVTILFTGGMVGPLNRHDNWSTPCKPSYLQSLQAAGGTGWDDATRNCLCDAVVGKMATIYQSCNQPSAGEEGCRVSCKL